MGAFTNAGGKFYIATTTSGSPAVISPSPKAVDLSEAEFEALTWTEVKNVGSLPESGMNTNVVSYDTLDTDVTQKAKGISNAGDGELEVARLAADPGQVALRAAASTKLYYAFKRTLTDAPDANDIPTIYYNRGLVTGPLHPGGRNEDFILETFKLGYVQKEVVTNTEVVA